MSVVLREAGEVSLGFFPFLITSCPMKPLHELGLRYITAGGFSG